jgi:hypothetical protein
LAEIIVLHEKNIKIDEFYHKKCIFMGEEQFKSNQI